MSCRIIVVTAIVLGSVSCMMMGCLSGDDKPVAQKTETKTTLPESDMKPIATETDTGLVRDLRLLRKTDTLPAKAPVQASSADAMEAAARVFGRLEFIGMSKEHVLGVLGNPATISDYGRKAGSEVDAPLIYRFDGGYGGYDYRVEFKDGRVTKVQKQGTY